MLEKAMVQSLPHEMFTYSELQCNIMAMYHKRICYMEMLL